MTNASTTIAFLALALALLLPAVAQAEVNVHKCRDADGRIAYQDTPCAGTELATPVVDPAPPRSVQTAPPAPLAPILAAPREAAAAVTRVELIPALAPLYRCTDFEGKSRVSASADGRGRYVPLWALDRFASSGVGQPLGAAGALYTYVEDQCRPMPRAEICAWWVQRRRALDGLVLRTFFAERIAYEQERIGLIESLRVHCGR